MSCRETVIVSAEAVNWLKEKYPELCIKAGLCERVAGRLYTKTYAAPDAPTQPAQRQPLTDEQLESIWKRHQFNGRPSEVSWANRMNLMRAIEAAHGIGAKP